MLSELISVVLPTYNRAHTISRALDSVFSQRGLGTEFKLQVIVVDDGSTDATLGLIETGYPAVETIASANRGVSSARNLGLARARGEWIALLDSDDEWLPNKLSRQIALLRTTGLQVCHTQEIWIRNGVRVNQMSKHKKQGGWIFKQCLPLCAMSPSSILMHQEVVANVGEFDETLPACEDYDYWLRLCSRYEVAYIQEPCITKYGGHEDQLSRQFWGMDRFRVQALIKILKQPLPPIYRQEALAVLRSKLNILLNGAKKHENAELIEYCENQLNSLDDLSLT